LSYIADRAVLVEHDELPSFGADAPEVAGRGSAPIPVVLGGSISGCLKVALARAADVERAHRELRARLADRLGGDDADRLADLGDRLAVARLMP
jgi:hypothetical protein